MLSCPGSIVVTLGIARPPRFRFKAGQYVRIMVPAISRHEWHPFTLSSAPGDPLLGLHIKVCPWAGAGWRAAAAARAQLWRRRSCLTSQPPPPSQELGDWTGALTTLIVETVAKGDGQGGRVEEGGCMPSPGGSVEAEQLEGGGGSTGSSGKFSAHEDGAAEHAAGGSGSAFPVVYVDGPYGAPAQAYQVGDQTAVLLAIQGQAWVSAEATSACDAAGKQLQALSSHQPGPSESTSAPPHHAQDYEVVVVVAAGIGVTPFASILRDLVIRVEGFRCSHCSKVRSG